MICFMNENPMFYKTVELAGKKIAVIKAKTHNDEAEIQQRCFKRKVIDGKIEFDVNFEKINIIRIRQALTDDPKVGWESEMEVTEDNISLLTAEYWNALLLATQELDSSWKDMDVEKNSD